MKINTKTLIISLLAGVALGLLLVYFDPYICSLQQPVPI